MKHSSLALSTVLVTCMGLIGCTSDTPPPKSPEIKHGTSEVPPSRQYYCKLQNDYNNGADNIKNAACRAAFIQAGNEDWERAGLFNNWNAYSMNLPDGTKPEDVVPDGELCSAANPKFKSINITSDAWHTTPFEVKNGRIQLAYIASQMHDPSEFRVFLTDQHHLTWAALKEAPDVKAQPVPGTGLKGPGHYYLDVQLPTGYITGSPQVIFIMWRRHEDPAGETFFSCSDVVLTDTKK